MTKQKDVPYVFQNPSFINEKAPPCPLKKPTIKGAEKELSQAQPDIFSPPVKSIDAFDPGCSGNVGTEGGGLSIRRALSELFEEAASVYGSDKPN